MTQTDDSIPAKPYIERNRRNLPASATLDWLAAGWRDFTTRPGLSLFYGVGVFLLSLAVVWSLFSMGLDYILFPALAGFMVVGPLVATGLYEKSRAIGKGETPTLRSMIFVKPASGYQIWFAGAILCVLMLLWMRAAVLIYALFFGYQPFPGLDHVTEMLFYTPTGWAMLVVGVAAGGLFAAFSFAISTFSIPMLLDEKTDAATAMGTSISMVWSNLPVMICWGMIVLGLFLISVATMLVGLIIVFP
ncbi:DUF2189 domain-containing protein, partial [Salmonella enterica subsp. enterica]|nr:DUF2189 domain-containing protein [Salmonella enterica subsp. enterica]